MRLGTRGFVTTLEDSTGSVGESSAPSRNDCVQDSEVSRCAADSDDHGGQRHRQGELSQRQPPVLLEHLAVDLQPVAEQDHDQGDRREVGDERGSRVEVKTFGRRRCRATKPTRTNIAVSERKLSPRNPGEQRAEDQQPAQNEQRDVEPCRR